MPAMDSAVTSPAQSAATSLPLGVDANCANSAKEADGTTDAALDQTLHAGCRPADTLLVDESETMVCEASQQEQTRKTAAPIRLVEFSSSSSENEEAAVATSTEPEDESFGSSPQSSGSPLFDLEDIGSTDASQADLSSDVDQHCKRESASKPAPPPTQALSIQPWFCAKILNQQKTWEIRGSSTKCRSRIALAATGTKQLWGEVTIISSELVARKNEHGEYCPEAGCCHLAASYDKHRIRNLGNLPYTQIWAWGLSDLCGTKTPCRTIIQRAK